jgi:hypothetical protein
MLNRIRALEETTLTNASINVNFIHSSSFHKWSHPHVAKFFVQIIAQHTKEGVYLFPHTQNRNKKNN